MKLSRHEFLRTKITSYFTGCLIVDVYGCKGGLALLWYNICNVEIVSYYCHHIAATISDNMNNQSWSCIRLYGEHQHEEHWRLWQLLKFFVKRSNPNVMVCGDFNEILTQTCIFEACGSWDILLHGVVIGLKSI